MADPQIILAVAGLAAFVCFVLVGIEIGHVRQSLRDALAKLRQMSQR